MFKKFIILAVGFILISCGTEIEVEVTTNGGEPAGSHDVVVTPATFNNGTTITFTDKGDAMICVWLGSALGGWNLLSNIGGTIA